MATVDTSSIASFCIIWAIEKVSPLIYIGYLRSPPFIAYSISDKALSLQIAEGEDFCCYLRSQDSFLEEASSEIDIEFSLLTTDGKTIVSKKTNENESHVALLKRDVYLERRAEFMPNSTLTVQCRMWKKGTEDSIGFCYARTELDIYRKSVLLAVEEFSTLHSSTAEDSSGLASDEKKAFTLQPPSVLEDCEDFILILFLQRTSELENVCVDFLAGNVRSHKLSCEISVSDANGKVVASNVEKGYMPDILKFRPLISKSKIVANKELFLSNDTLLLMCTYEIFLGFISSRVEYCTPNVSSQVEHFIDSSLDMHMISEDNSFDMEEYLQYFEMPDNETDNFSPFSAIKKPTEYCSDSCYLKAALKYLHNDAILSDISLQIQRNRYPAHKNILSSRCPIFQKILGGNIKRKFVVIDDMSCNTLGHLLKFIYTDAVEDLDYENTLELYKAADKYELLNLRPKCTYLLRMNHLCDDNASEILSLAKEYQDVELEKAVRGIQEFDEMINKLKNELTSFSFRQEFALFDTCEQE